jgi:hypothetical protein
MACTQMLAHGDVERRRPNRLEDQSQQQVARVGVAELRPGATEQSSFSRRHEQLRRSEVAERTSVGQRAGVVVAQQPTGVVKQIDDTDLGGLRHFRVPSRQRIVQSKEAGHLCVEYQGCGDEFADAGPPELGGGVDRKRGRLVAVSEPRAPASDAGHCQRCINTDQSGGLQKSFEGLIETLGLRHRGWRQSANRGPLRRRERNSHRRPGVVAAGTSQTRRTAWFGTCTTLATACSQSPRRRGCQQVTSSHIGSHLKLSRWPW